MTVESVRRVAIVVLGEIGQSPRMQLHAQALLDHGVPVDIVAYGGDATPRWLLHDPGVTLWPLPPPGWADRHGLPRAVFLAYSLCRVLRISWSLLWTLSVRLPRPDVFLLQTPPAVPAMAICLLAAWLQGARVVVDWHNYGYSILALGLGKTHWAVGLTSWWERRFGRLGARHLCVSQAMAQDLAERWGIPGAIVLYDRPPERFGETGEAERRQIFDSLGSLLPTDMALALARRAEIRPALLISPTSWTVDEDFALLFDALEDCDQEMTKEEKDAQRVLYPDLMVLITGNGPLRSRFEERIAALDLRRISIRTAWVPHEDFPALLGSSDLGLCLHRSSSGVDLPMKIAEMQGANLPVCAFDYGTCLREMVVPDETGLLFTDGASLSRHLRDLFRGFPAGAVRLAFMRETLRARPRKCWRQEWNDHAAPVFGLTPAPAGPPPRQRLGQ